VHHEEHEAHEEEQIISKTGLTLWVNSKYHNNHMKNLRDLRVLRGEMSFTG
jgi:hypothetical protein